MFHVEHENELKDVAQFLSELLLIYKVICITGDLGSGKTTLVKFIIQSMSSEHIEVTSPTFNLVHIYDISNTKLWHFDLYRLKHIEEIHELGIEDAFKALSIIEWPLIIEPILPADYIDVKINFGKNNNQRDIRIAYTNKKI